MWVSENTLYVRAHVIDAFVGSVHFEVVFGDADVTVFMRKQEESLFGEFQGHLGWFVDACSEAAKVLTPHGRGV